MIKFDRRLFTALGLLALIFSPAARPHDPEPMTAADFATFSQGVGAGVAVMVAKLYPDATSISRCIAAKTPKEMYAGISKVDKSKYAPTTPATIVLVDWLVESCLEQGKLAERLRSAEEWKSGRR